MLHSWNKMLHKNNIQTAKIILWNENHGSMKNSTESLEDPIKEIFQKVEKKEQELENKREGPLLHQSSPVSFFLFILSFLLSLFQANSLERGGPLSPLSCPGFWDPLEKAPCAFTHSRGRPVPTCSSASPKNRALWLSA